MVGGQLRATRDGSSAVIPDPGQRPLLTVDELLEAVPAWPSGRSATYEAVRRGDLPSVRIGGRLYILTAQLRQMLGLDDLLDVAPAIRRRHPYQRLERDEDRVAIPGLREDSHRLGGSRRSSRDQP